MPRAGVWENHAKSFGGGGIFNHQGAPFATKNTYDSRASRVEYAKDPIFLPAIGKTPWLQMGGLAHPGRRSRSPSPIQDKEVYGNELRMQMEDERRRKEEEKYPWKAGTGFDAWMTSLAPTKADEERWMRLQQGRTSPTMNQAVHNAEQTGNLNNSRSSLPQGPQDSPLGAAGQTTQYTQGPQEWSSPLQGSPEYGFLPPDLRPGFLPSIAKDEGLWRVGTVADERNKERLGKLQYGAELMEQVRQQKMRKKQEILQRKEGGWGSDERRGPSPRRALSPEMYRAQLDAQLREKRDRESERRGSAVGRGRRSSFSRERDDGGRDTSPQDLYRAHLDAQIREKQDRIAEEKRRERERQLREERDFEEYNPWGRAGAGAPLRDSTGNIISDIRRSGMRGISFAPAGDAVLTPPSQTKRLPIDTFSYQTPLVRERNTHAHLNYVDGEDPPRMARTREIEAAVGISDELLKQVSEMVSQIKAVRGSVSPDAGDGPGAPLSRGPPEKFTLLYPNRVALPRSGSPSPSPTLKTNKETEERARLHEKEMEEQERISQQELASLREIIEQQHALREQLVRQSRLMASLEQSLVEAPPADEYARQELAKYSSALQRDEATRQWMQTLGIGPEPEPEHTLHTKRKLRWGHEEDDDDLPPAIIRSEASLVPFAYEKPRPPSEGLSKGAQRARSRLFFANLERQAPDLKKASSPQHMTQ